ncbi:hypothetical protein P6U16_08330 [Rhizobium sp. 32-5/1]|uniref:hypothetical protein n=1 Tax=Rhizobium sp. 32-5/1 TaxID=3019602 RepID=UPI00240D0C9E|nr:hypothetical protein [Rhizobium sp. 32-5/1]WEZ84566.1 hypothetical protein P6U16_08330 [Rhizobium sp. 32-5/1]
MPNTDTERAYENALQAQLGERVTNLGRRQSDLESEMRSGFKQMENALAGFANETRASIASLSSNMAERNKPQWQALGVALTFAAMLGGLAYMPIREATSDLKSSVSSLASMMVTRQEMDWRQARGAEDRARTDAAVTDLRASQVPRQELERVWISEDQQRAQMQKQIDELKANSAATYGARDALLDMRDRLDRLERMRVAASP